MRSTCYTHPISIFWETIPSRWPFKSFPSSNSRAPAFWCVFECPGCVPGNCTEGPWYVWSTDHPWFRVELCHVKIINDGSYMPFDEHTHLLYEEHRIWNINNCTTAFMSLFDLDNRSEDTYITSSVAPLLKMWSASSPVTKQIRS